MFLYLERFAPAIHTGALLLRQRQPEVRLLHGVPVIGDVDHSRAPQLYVSPILLSVGVSGSGSYRMMAIRYSQDMICEVYVTESRNTATASTAAVADSERRS